MPNLTFRVDYHGERARACQQQAETLGKLLGTLRGQREALHARTLTAKLATEAQRLSRELEERKALLSPLLETVEKIHALVRSVDLHNQTCRSALIPTPRLHGDPGIIQRLYDFKLQLPPEWFGRDPQRRDAGRPISDRELL